jgi:hypothetical protein
MRNSHVFSLIEEAFEKVQEFNYKRYINELNRVPQEIYLRGLKVIVNKILGKFGFHLMYKNKLEELIALNYWKMGKWGSIGILQLALENPEKFDEVYNLLFDEDSKNTFDWFIRYRVAYSFLGELAGEVFPPKITKAEFLKGINALKSNNLKGLISIRNFSFKSWVDATAEVAETWIFENYHLKGKCEVAEGDYVIDGGAFRGETSFYFLSKGAGRVYSFEPDPYNFSVLIENIKKWGGRR